MATGQGKKKSEVMRCYFDTEDNSESIENSKDKQVTQICAVTDKGSWYQGEGNTDLFIHWMVKNRVTTAYAHNLKYDLGNLFCHRLDDLDFLCAGSRIIKATYAGITFRDSSNMYGPVKLQSLGDAFGIQKLPRDLTGWDYVRRDVEILREAVQRWEKFVTDYDVSRMPATLSGAAIKIWQAMGGDNWHCDKQIAHDALYGGRVELFDVAGEIGRYGYLDFNSLYPWAMQSEFADGEKKLNEVTPFGVFDVSVSVPDMWCPVLPYRGKSGLYFPHGKWRGVYTGRELLYAIERGVSVRKLHYGIGSKTGSRYYCEFVRHFYDKRLASVSSAEKLLFKIFMNGLYGQLGMTGNLVRTRELRDSDFDKNDDLITEGIPFGEKIFVETSTELPGHVNYIHAAEITAEARIRLHREMMKHEGKLCYCDTDSIFVRLKPDEIPASGKGLGELKLEGIEDYAKFHAPKMYEWGRDKAVAKGVPVQMALEFISGGVVSFKKPVNLLTALHNFDSPMGPRLSAWEPKTRQRRKGYTKKMLTGNTYSPINVSEVP